MKIPLKNGYVLLSDTYNFWIVKERASEKTGKKYEQPVSGYYNNLNDLFVGFIDRKIGGSDAESIKELTAEINKLKRTVKGWKKLVTLEAVTALENKEHDKV